MFIPGTLDLARGGSGSPKSNPGRMVFSNLDYANQVEFIILDMKLTSPSLISKRLNLPNPSKSIVKFLSPCSNLLGKEDTKDPSAHFGIFQEFFG